MSEPGEYLEGVEALREHSRAVSRLAAETSGGTRTALLFVAGQLRGLALRFERLAPEGHASVALTSKGVELAKAWEGYPEGWPACPGCKRPALDGKATCGDVRCGPSTGVRR